jgi:hypothetical protein
MAVGGNGSWMVKTCMGFIWSSGFIYIHARTDDRLKGLH